MKFLKIYLTICLILYPAVFASKFYDIDLLEKILIPLFVTIVFAFNLLLNPPTQGNNMFLFFAFLLVSAGDYLINLTHSGGWFIIPFVLVHVLLILYFFKERTWKLTDVKILIFILLLMLIVHLISLPFIEKVAYKIVFILYSLLLSIMLWRAICFAQTKIDFVHKFLIVGGALLFLITDMAVSLNIVFQTKILVAITWICYVPALVMLSIMNLPLRKYD